VKKTRSAPASSRRLEPGETRPQDTDRELKLPHERDEGPESPGPRQRVIRQAAKDLARGLIDTDNYTRAALVAARADKRRRRGS